MRLCPDGHFFCLHEYFFPGEEVFCPGSGRFSWIKSSASAKRPHSAPNSGTKPIAAAKHPHLDCKTGTKCITAAKYPHSGRKTGRNLSGRKKGDPTQCRSPFSYWDRTCNPLQCSLNLNNLVCLNNVTNFNVVVAVDVQTAIVAAVNLLNIVLEAFQ